MVMNAARLRYGLTIVAVQFLRLRLSDWLR